ncbi:FtsK/SpoIIIE domain-containing protein [Amycolatopsis nigrescens]|uniref:FtsK/SpoIIIE domain-containing protein n=1 Tax=Amycolatopsis nigrescens TaxID=381445 RepID=UPI00037D9546|nr:FtsK/SpoIIIE domain-containing protein [Amycolatopsis nigrescens]
MEHSDHDEFAAAGRAGEGVEEVTLARVHRLPERAGEVLEGEAITEEEYRRLTSQKEQALARYRGYRNDVVTLYRFTRTVLSVSGRAVKAGGGPAVRFTRRHLTIIAKGAEAERQRKKTERAQGDARTARAHALEKGDLAQVTALNAQVQDSRHLQVDTLDKWVDVVWKLTRKTALALAVTLGVALVVGVFNGFGGWFGDWDAGDVLDTVGALGSTAGAVVAWSVAHWWLFGLAALVVWSFRRWKDGARLGEFVLPEHLRREGKRVQQTELSENLLVKALGNLGNRYLNQAIKDGWPNRDTDHAWVKPPMPEGKGWGVQIRLPMGASVEAMQRAKTTLAHNLGCLPAELFLDKSEDDPTVLDLFRLDRGVLREPVPEYPLLHDGVTDYFTGFPVGIVPRGDEVLCPVFQRNFLFAGEMGSGKSTGVLAMICSALLDPLVDVEVWLFSDNQDYETVEPALAGFNSCKDGVTPAALTAALMDRFAELNTELETRGQLLRKHGVKEVTRAVAAKEPGLRPKLIVVDECQTFFHQDESELRKKIVKMVNDFYMRARKFAVTVAWATPDPSDANLPRGMVSVTSNRACYAIKDKGRNNVVLGEKAHENGLSALGLKPSVRRKDGTIKLNDVGTAITLNFLDSNGTVRFYYLSPEQQRIIVERALELRGGTVPGQLTAPVERDPLADILTVARLIQPREGEDHPRAAAIADALGARWTRYQNWRIADVVTALAEHGYKVPSTDRIHPVDPAKVAEAITRRDTEAGE